MGLVYKGQNFDYAYLNGPLPKEQSSKKQIFYRKTCMLMAISSHV